MLSPVDYTIHTKCLRASFKSVPSLFVLCKCPTDGPPRALVNSLPADASIHLHAPLCPRAPTASTTTPQGYVFIPLHSLTPANCWDFDAIPPFSLNEHSIASFNRQLELFQSSCVIKIPGRKS